MTIPFDAIIALTMSLLGIMSAIAHKSRCFLRHVNARWDWGLGYGDRPITPTSFDDPPNRVIPQTTCAPILKMWAERLRATTLARR